MFSLTAKLVRIVLAFGACLFCAAPATAASSDGAALHELFEEYFERSLQLNPLLATFIGDHRFDDRLANDISPAHIQAQLDHDRHYLEAATKFRGFFPGPSILTRFPAATAFPMSSQAWTSMNEVGRMIVYFIPLSSRCRSMRDFVRQKSMG